MWVSFVTVRTAREFRLTFLFQLKMTELPSLKLPTWLFLFSNSIQPHSLIFFSSVVLSPNIHHDSYSVCIYSFVCKRHTYFLQLNVTFVYDSDSQGNDDLCCHNAVHAHCRCVPCKLCNQEETLSYHLHLQHSQNL